MDLLNDALSSVPPEAAAGPASITLVLSLSFMLTGAVAVLYRATHRGSDWSPAFAQTLVLLGMVVAITMLIVGSNMARAFSLVGALSVVRFRNAVKDTRDVGFVFLVMAVGMACGARLYGLALLSTAVLGAVVMLMHALSPARRPREERVLRLRLPLGCDFERTVAPIFAEHLEHSHLLAVETAHAGVLQEVSYGVVFKESGRPSALLDALRAVNGNNKIVLASTAHAADAD